MGVEPAKLVELQGVEKSFFQDGARLDILHGVDFTMATGEMVAIVGKSGAGKSTLLHIVGSIDTPTAGVVRVCDRIIYSEPGSSGNDVGLGAKKQSGKVKRKALEDHGLAKFRNQQVAFVFQSHHLLADLTAVENAALPQMIAGAPRKHALAQSEQLLDRVGLAERLMHYPKQLSGGERQRVAIARALVNEPELVLCDEPTGNLDQKAAESFFELLSELNDSRQQSVIIVTHDLELAKKAGRVLELEDGLLRSDFAATTGHANGQVDV